MPHQLHRHMCEEFAFKGASGNVHGSCVLFQDVRSKNIEIAQDTGKMPEGGSYAGSPIHTLTIFANPFLEDPPNPLGDGVQTVEAGQPSYHVTAIAGG